jgi:hypothetical protein
MTFKASMFLQGFIGVFTGSVFLIAPQLVLDFVALAYDNSSVILMRLLSLFIIILCSILLFIRTVQDVLIQKHVLLTNMIGNFAIALFCLWATLQEGLTFEGGSVLTLFMLGNVLSHAPVYWNLWEKGNA